MPKRVDPYAQVERALSRAAASDKRAAGRLARLQGAIARAEFSSGMHPLDHLLVVLSMLEATGNPTAGINVTKVRSKAHAAKV